MKITFLSLLSATWIGAGHAAIFRMDYLPVGHVRTDPILSQTCLSGHVHTFYGPPLIYPAVTSQDLLNSDPNLSSGNVQENLSLYWHPSVYRVEADGRRTLRDSQMTTVYYRYVPGETRAFPPGFRMIGLEALDSEANCADPQPCTREICGSLNNFFPSSQCSELEVSMSFPHCWDGVNLYLDDQSHVTTPDGGVDAPCPPSHPVRLPMIEFFFRIFDYDGGPYEFSDGTGHFHADYIAGWDEAVLQNILDNCDIDQAQMDSGVHCPQFTHRNGFKYGDTNTDAGFVQLLAANAVPFADTSCITTEPITDIVILPSGSCTGTLISPTASCNGENHNTSTPTSLPTSRPTTAPVAAPPTATSTYDCDNDPDQEIELYIQRRDEYVLKTCDWLTRRDSRPDNWCGRMEWSQDIPVYEICQIECAHLTGC